MILSLAGDAGPDSVASLLVDANETAARQLYNRIQTYNPIHKARVNTLLTATLLPKQTLGVYSVEGSEKVLTASEALGLEVVPRTRQQVAAMATDSKLQLEQPARHKLHNSASEPRTAMAYLNSSLPKVMTTVDEHPVRQELARMAYSHFQEVGDKMYQFSYTTDD